MFMPAACYVGSVHFCGSVDTEGSGNVFINGSPAHRIGDGDSHGGIQAEGSPNVFVNNIPLARVGDNNIDELLHPPNPEAVGSPNVYCNG
jgi:uncharacterized Zn-binding protein involved in type VI secretion